MNLSSSVQEVLQQIIDLNTSFCDSIADGDWATATQLENQRRQRLQCLFEQPMQPEVRRRVLDTLTELLQSDRRLVENLQVARDHCSSQISRMQLGKHAARSYESTGLMVAGPKMMQ